MENQQFNSYAIIELFGHQKIAGKVSEQSIGGSNFVRVDVPETKKSPAYTKLFGQGAIYSILLTDEISANAAAESCATAPVELWRFQDYIKQNNIKKLPDIQTSDISEDDYDSFSDDDDDDF